MPVVSPKITEDGQAMVWAGQTLRPIDDGGVYYYDPSSVPVMPMPSPSVPLKDVLDRHGFHGAARCRLMDFVECSGTDHGFSDDERSRVLRLADGDLYRVTAPTKPLSLFSYRLATRAKPGKPQLMVLQLINDRERYTSANLRLAGDAPWAEPYTGAETYQPESQEGGTMRLDVGANVYTGREYPCDGKPFYFPILFYPKGDRIKVIVSHTAAELDADLTSGAAVARMWLFDILDPLPPAIERKPGLGERRIGLYYPHPWFLYDRFGVPSRTKEERLASLTAFADYMGFCGFNQLQLHIINGSDAAGRAWYDSKLYPMNQGNLIQELVPICEKRGIQFVPIVTPIYTTINDESKATDQPDEQGFSRLSLQVDAEGRFIRTMGRLVPDPLRPEVQDWLIMCYIEILDRCAASPAVPAVGFRVNGKIGLCYANHRISWPNAGCGHESGYSEWDVAEFEKDTGVQVPREKPTPYKWLRENAWDKWLDWRCRRMREFWLKVRDLVRTYRPDLMLLVATDLPSETPGYNVEWPSGISVRDLYRHHGYDPELYKNDEGIVIQWCMMVNADRFWTNTWWPYDANVWAHKEFNYAPEVARSYATKGPQWVEFYHNYWEEHPHPDMQYGNMRTCTGAPIGDLVFEPATYGLRASNVASMTFMGWERPSAGHEQVMRRFARAFRAIPMTEPKEFDGKVEILSSGEDKMPKPESPNGDRYARAANGPVWVKWYGSRLAVMNDASFVQEIRLTLANPLGAGQCLFEYGAGRVVAKSGGEIRVPLAPHDLRVYEALPASDGARAEAASVKPAAPMEVPAEAQPVAYVKPTVDVRAISAFGAYEAGSAMPVDCLVRVEMEEVHASLELRVADHRAPAADLRWPAPGREEKLTALFAIPAGLASGSYCGGLYLVSGRSDGSDPSYGADRFLGSVPFYVVQPCPKASGKLKVDGDLADWRELDDLVGIGSERFRGDDKANDKWSYSQSPELFLAWDADFLYAACRANRQLSPAGGKGGFGVCFDTLAATATAYRAAGYSQFEVVSGSSGPVAKRSGTAPNSDKPTKSLFAAAASGGRVVYEIAVPWDEIGLQATVGNVLGFACRVADAVNGERRELTWGGGVGRDRDWPEMIRVRLGE